MIKIKTKSGITLMSPQEFSRWGCLIEAYEFIHRRANELNVDVEHFIKPIAIEKYIDERYPCILHDVTIEHQMGLI